MCSATSRFCYLINPVKDFGTHRLGQSELQPGLSPRGNVTKVKRNRAASIHSSVDLDELSEIIDAEAGEQRRQRRRAAADLVGQGRQTDRHALLGIALRLPVERLMLAKFLEQHHRQQAWPRPAAGDHVERRRRLADLLAITAGELLASPSGGGRLA